MRRFIMRFVERAAMVTIAAAAVQSPGSWGQDLVETVDNDVVVDELRCLALSLYWEARSEGEEGMIAVGSVVLNRVEHDEFPSTVCGVVYQGGETPPCQFSWWCDGKSDQPIEPEMWQLAVSVAESMLSEAPKDPTGGALFFHSADIAVPWRIERTLTARILRHVYYR
jgi:spore germination cell wall hydrolase CwlJ-like protein